MWHDAQMLFAGVPLARRIEQAECRLMADSAEAVRRDDRDADVLVMPLAGGVAIFAGAGSPMNKVAGLGFAGPVDEAALVAVEHEFARRGAQVQVELSSLAEPTVGAMLTGRGYSLVGFEDVLGMPLDDTALPRLKPDGISVTKAAPDETAVWIDTVITGFETPDPLAAHEPFERAVVERTMKALALDFGYRRYLARRDGAIAGGASLRLTDGIAQLCGAATLPNHRRRGVQSALLGARLADAVSEGCDIAVLTTQPGSKSQENGIRQGFTLLYTRAILRREVY